MNSDDLYPFRASERLEFDIVDALLTHVPMLWRRPDLPDAAPCALTAVRDAWDALCSVGVGGLMVPTEHGGQGASLSRSLSVAWTLSRIPAPVPFLSSAVLAPLLAAALDERELLSEIATGDTVVAIAFGGRVEGDHDGTTTLRGGVNAVLHGSDAARWFIVAESAETGKSILAVDRPASTIQESSPDVTRPLSRARFDGTPARRLALRADALVGEVVRRAHLVRCVEVLAAASIAVRDDPTSMASIAAAITAVRSAAAATDLHGTCDSRHLDVACSRTAMVSRLVRDRRSRMALPHELRADLCAGRATGASVWLPPELCVDDDDQPLMPTKPEVALTAAGRSGGERRPMHVPRIW